jgi:SAM-dependent methyltransferase
LVHSATYRAAGGEVSDHAEVMTRWYTEKSGPGSTVEFSAPYRAFVGHFIFEHDVQSVVDLGCGDGVIASHINWRNANYVGIDCIAERIERNRLQYPLLNFACADVRTCCFSTDLVLVKDVIQHWPTADIVEWLSYLRRTSAFKYALITNCNYERYGSIEGKVNTDVPIGGWRAIDLIKPPFEIGEIAFSWGQPNKDVVLIGGNV